MILIVQVVGGGIISDATGQTTKLCVVNCKKILIVKGTVYLMHQEENFEEVFNLYVYWFIERL